MSKIPLTTATSNPAQGPAHNFQAIFNAALDAYEEKTKKVLLAHPLAAQLQACSSPGDILAVLQDEVKHLEKSRSADEKSLRWLTPTINVLYAFSATLGVGAGFMFSPATMVFSGIGVLLSAAKGVGDMQDGLVDLFERIENFFKRLESYTQVPPTEAMTEITVKIMVEVLNILALATVTVKRGRAGHFFRRLGGNKELENALQTLDKLTNEEARMAAAQILKVVHNVNDVVTVVDDNVAEVKNKMKGIEDRVDIVTNDVKEAKVVMLQTVNMIDDLKWTHVRKCLREWVSPPDPSTNHIIAYDSHHEGTAIWFFQGSIFGEWKSKGSLLWIYGKPGSGKTVLCSAVIQDVLTLRDVEQACVVYFYFDFRDRDKQNRRNLLASLLIQLSARSAPCCKALSSIREIHENGERQPSDEVLIHCLRDMLTIVGQHPTYIILDALDECPNSSGIPSPRQHVLALVKELVGLSLPNLHLCVTSRPEVDIRSTLEPLAPHRVSLHGESGQKQDIVKYINSIVYSDADTMMKKWRRDEKESVVETLSERADGMFRWVFCQLETLRECLPGIVRQTIRELPESLDETYERVIGEIKKANRAHAYRLLQCLMVAIRPLYVEELAEVLAFDFDSAPGGIPKFNASWCWHDQEEAVLSTCSSLVTVAVANDSRRVVQFSHFSVKEFLMSDRLAKSEKDSHYHISLENAHTVLAQACLGILLSDRSDKDGANRDHLAKYAAKHWMAHAQFQNVSSKVRYGIEQLFDVDKPYFDAWVRLHDVDHIIFCSNAFDKKRPEAKRFYYAALCGLHHLVKSLIRKYPQYASDVGGNYGSALHVASDAGRLQVVRLLLKHGVKVDVRGMWDQTPLQFASDAGHLDVVKLLLDHGADANSEDESRWTPLFHAISKGHLDVVRKLLDHDARVNIQDNTDGRTPLHVAFLRDKPQSNEIVRLLLERGASPNARDKAQQTPLHLLTPSKRELVAVLKKPELGADFGAKDKQGRTPSQALLKRGHSELAKLVSN